MTEIVPQARPRGAPLPRPQTTCQREPQPGDLILLAGRQGSNALCAVVSELEHSSVVQFLLWEGKKLPSVEKLHGLPGLLLDGRTLAKQPLLRWIEPRYRPLFFIVSGRLAGRGRIVAHDQSRLTESWREANVQRGHAFCIETSWEGLCDYYIGSGSLYASLDATRQLVRRRNLFRR